jgi:C1A family cysteine protease
MNQNPEGACTGHAVCAAAEFHYWKRTGKKVDLSQRWAYRKARENDPWPGENYHGSSTRSAIKAWADFGICEEAFWPYVAYKTDPSDPSFDLPGHEGQPKEGAVANALKYPLQTYSRCRTLYQMKHAIHEYGLIIVSGVAHSGWDIWDSDTITYDENVYELGGHAYVLVGYDEAEKVFFLVNSWGPDWGENGFAKYSYDDAKVNVRDAWVVTVPA